VRVDASMSDSYAKVVFMFPDPYFIAKALSEEISSWLRSKITTGKLHCSQILSPLRHLQLGFVFPGDGIVTLENFSEVIPVTTGQLWHEFLSKAVRNCKYPCLSEINLDAGLPEGWTGTADLLVTEDSNSWILYDLKTLYSLKALDYIPKDEHIWQVSCYYHALREIGFSVTDVILYYLPILPGTSGVSQTDSRGIPIIVEPIDKEIVWEEMYEIRRSVLSFAESYEKGMFPENLAPFPDPTFKLQKLKTLWKVWAYPHWSYRYCIFGDICGCSNQPEKRLVAKYYPRSSELELFIDNEPHLEPKIRSVINESM
jgi:hypothetical protein